MLFSHFFMQLAGRDPRHVQETLFVLYFARQTRTFIHGRPQSRHWLRSIIIQSPYLLSLTHIGAAMQGPRRGDLGLGLGVLQYLGDYPQDWCASIAAFVPIISGRGLPNIPGIG